MLKNALHVPCLDCNLFSAVRHGCNGQRFVFILGYDQMSLSFPEFEISQKISDDFDLRISLDPLNESDWHISHHTCDGQEADDLSTLESQLNLLNRIYYGRMMTRAQRKQQMEREQELHSVLGNKKHPIRIVKFE